MYVYTNVGNANAHVTAYSSFVLAVDKSVVAPADDVTFTPLLDGQATAAARWKWKPSIRGGVDNAPCPNGASSCTKKVMATGTMRAYLSSTPGTGDSASALVTVDTTLSNGGTGGSGGGATCPVGALCSAAKLTVIRSDGVAGTQVPPDVSSYPVGTSVPYSFAPGQGYREIALVVDDTGRATAGSVTMDHDHTIEVGADSDYALNNDIAAIGDSLWNLVHSTNAPADYSRFLRWYRDQASVRGDDALRRAVGLASYARFDLARDSAVLNAFDKALAGVVFHISRAGAATDFDYILPSEYRDTTSTITRIGRRVHGTDPRRLAVAIPTDTTTIVYVNGIRTDSAEFEVSTKLLVDLVRSTSIASRVYVDHFYNPTFAIEQKSWDQSGMCAVKAERDIQYTNYLIGILHYAACAGKQMGKWLQVGDMPQSIWQLEQQKHDNFGITAEQTALDLAAYTSRLHRARDATIFVTHSQGNLMFSQMIPNLGAFESPQSRCIAELSLSSPIGSAHFGPLPANYLVGLTIKWDILLQLAPYTDNDFFVRTDFLSDSADAAFVPLSGARLFKAKVDWGLRIHQVNENYLGNGLRGLVGSSLEDLVDKCDSWSPL